MVGKVYIPDPTLFSPKELRDMMLAATKKTLVEIDRKLKQTTATWEHRPDFRTIGPTAHGNQQYSGIVGTDDENYERICRGAEPHTITARSGGLVVYKAGYKAKTSPRKIGSTRGGKSGPTRHAKRVRHPGFEARDFDKEIAHLTGGRAVRDVDEKMKKWAMKQNAKKSRVRAV